MRIVWEGPASFKKITKIDGPVERHIEQLWDEIKKLKERVDELERTLENVNYNRGNMDWICIKDRLPEFETMVLAYDTQKIYICYRPIENEYNEHWKICDECCSCYGATGAITHWMPLPLYPKE